MEAHSEEEERNMEKKAKRIEFRFGKFGKLAPLIVAAGMILWAAFSQSNVNMGKRWSMV